MDAGREVGEGTGTGPPAAARVRPRRGLMRVVGMFDTTTKVIAAVTGLILAAAGLWAALHQVLAPAPAAGSPTSSAGSPTSSANAAEVRAARVQACEQAHGMSQSTQTFAGTDGLPTAVRLCEWPQPSYADQDGFTQIAIETVDGPGKTEASGASQVDRLSGPCAEFLLAYDFGTQGASQHLAPFLAKPGDRVTPTGDSYPGVASDLGFYPTRTEVDVIRTYSSVLFTASCQH